MTTISLLISALEQWLPDDAVVSDLRRIIKSEAGARVQLDSGTITIPSDCQYEVVSKAFIEQRFDIGLGNCVRAVVAIGGVQSICSGVVYAKHCFCTLWYNDERSLITTDFSKDAPL